MDNVVEFSVKSSAQQNDTGFADTFAYLADKGGGVTVLPVGFIDISVPLSLPVGVSICGVGTYLSKLRAISPMPAMVQIIGDGSNFREGHQVRNLSLHGNNQAIYGLELDCAILTNLFSGLHIRDCLQSGFKTVGQRVDFSGGCWGNILENSKIWYCGRGVELGQASNLFHIRDCYIQLNSGAAIVSETSAVVNISGCSIEKNGTLEAEQIGLWVKGGYGVSVSGCYFEGNGNGAGSHIYTEKSALNAVDGMTVSGCYFNGLDDKTEHALNVGDGTVSIIGGQSNRHAGKTIFLRENGIVSQSGFISTDRAGMI